MRCIIKGVYCTYITMVLSFAEKPLCCYYHCGLPLQYYCDTIVRNIYVFLKEEIINMVDIIFCMYTFHFWTVQTETYRNIV